MGIGYILVIVVAGLLASYFFGKLAKEKGYPAAKARRYPILLMIAAVIVSLAFLGSAFLLGIMMENLRNVLSMVYMLANWFLIAVYLVVLNKAYSNMKEAPDAQKLRERMEALQKERAEAGAQSEE
ncbi:hypothetical protein SAMN02745181_3155 [Rubritalea squalenifaciens DSM 18772]|uniref:Uncharacterized protein n=1 Tax=Rubritalea squalenifaciens DSM 18772 TaxID=1123071 RepID=A0A1M6PDI8_9BACT|nr:hypothetical protein [Rubritalea squalenifaciens]SHK05987.1 hypothetical protein SAMN02745181_3155 [Rubritalea squalenifaciens DSM 18772]